mgnify:CR=1 FL=1
MAENNFYEWLELPVEKFESDPAKLKPILEKCITDWKSNTSDLEKEHRVAIYEKSMRAAIEDSVLWKQIYEEYKHSVDEKIVNLCMTCADSQKIIASDKISAIATNCKISVPYIEKIAKENGYKLKTSTPVPPVPSYSLKDLEPPLKIRYKLDGIQKLINQLGFPTLAELIASETGNKNNLYSLSKDNVAEALKDIKEKWNKKSNAGGNKNQKSAHLKKICVGMEELLNDFGLSVYIQYLNWKKVNEILSNLYSELNSLKLDVLNNYKYNDTIDNIFSVIGNKEKSKSILDNYCSEKNISYPKPLPNIAICPYCSNSFEKSNPIQSNCPCCNKSFVVVCPKCGKRKNILSESNCDGIELLQFPYLERQLKETQHFFDALDVVTARYRIEDIRKKWPDFPHSDEALDKCKTIEKNYGADLKKMKLLMDSHHFYEARIICDRLSITHPQFKIANKSIYDAIATADALYKNSKTEKDTDKRIEKLLEVLTLVADHPEANADINGHKLLPIQKLSVNISSGCSAIVLSWTSQNKPNSVYYTIKRKTKTPISNHADGEKICVTQTNSFSDTDVIEGEPYYYAVYASRGPQQSSISATSDAVIFLKKPEAIVTSKECGASFSWEYSSMPPNIRAFISDRPISRYGEGTPCSGITPSGFDIEKLVNGKKYYVGLTKVINYLGKEYYSECAVYNFTPMQSIKSPEISKSIGTKDGEYIITHTNPTDNSKVELYYSSNQALITSNSTLNLSDLKKSLRKASITELGNHQYSFNMNGASKVFIYPVICRGDIATVGNYLCLRYTKPIQVTRGIISGNKLCMYIDKWVDGADTIFICYNTDVYPQDKNDADRRISVTKNEYERTKLLEIPNIENQEYYISLFARKSGEYIPVCNYYFDNSSSKSKTIDYFFKVGIFGDLTVILKGEATNLPSIDVCVDSSCVPLTKQSGTIIYTIPSRSLEGYVAIKIPNYKVKKNTYARLFSDNSNFILRLKSGNGKIK